MNIRRIVAGLVAIIVLSMGAVTVQAAGLSETQTEIKDLQMKLNLPSEWDVMTPDLPDDAEVYVKNQLTSDQIQSIKENWKANNVLLDTISADVINEITITKAEWDDKDGIVNLNQLKDADLESTKASMLTTMTEKNYTVSSSEIKKIGELTFFTIDGKVMVNGSFRNAYQYITIVNSNMITFNLTSSSTIEQENKDLMDAMIKSVTFDKLDEGKNLYRIGGPLEPLWSKALIRGLIGLVAMAIIIGAVTLIRKLRNQKRM